MIWIPKGTYDKLGGQTAQNILSCRATSYGLSKYSGEVMTDGRNRPLLTIRARNGLSGASVPQNCWIPTEY